MIVSELEESIKTSLEKVRIILKCTSSEKIINLCKSVRFVMCITQKL